MTVNAKSALAFVPQERIDTLLNRANKHTTVQLMQEIDRLKEIGLTIPQIAQTLGAVQRTAVRNLYDSRARHAARKALDQGCLNSLVAVAEISEIVLLELGNMKIHALAGTLNLTPEQIGTLQRAAEKAIETAKILAGKDPTKLAPDKPGPTTQPSALDRARANLQALEAKHASTAPLPNPVAGVVDTRAAAVANDQDAEEDE